MPRWLPLLAGCGGPTADGGGPKTKERKSCRRIADLTVPPQRLSHKRGNAAYVDNLTQGGVDGQRQGAQRGLPYKVPTAEEKYKKFVAEGAVAIQGWGTGDSEALRSKVKDDELPFMSASYAEVLTDPKQSPYNFVVAPTYSDQLRVAIDYIAAQDPAAQLAVLHHDSPFGTAPLADAQKWIKEKGYRLGFRAYPMKAGATDHVGVLQQAKSQGARYVVIQNVSSPAAVVAKDIAAQKLDMKIVCLNWCAEEIFIKVAVPPRRGN